MFIINNKKIFFILSIALILASLFSMFNFGFKQSIDFTGGALLEVQYQENRPTTKEIKENLQGLELENLNIQETGDNGLILRFSDIAEATHLSVLSNLGDVEELRFEAIGPVIGKELQKAAFWGIIWVLAAILVYVAWAFRHSTKTIRSWRFGIIALIALFHDVLISAGIFSFLGYFYGFQLDIPFVAAMLTILGYSVNDTIVVFDRVRENLVKGNFKNKQELGGKSITQTIMRSINTSGTTLLVLVGLLLLGPTSLVAFVSILIIGVVIGTYSSIFIATPLLLSKKQ